jgi:hypothetical protein
MAPALQQEDGLYFADQSILNIFSVPMLEGNRDRNLLEPNTMVITKSLLINFFLVERLK